MTDDSLSDAVQEAQNQSTLQNAKQSYNGLKREIGIPRGGSIGIDLVFVFGGLFLAIQSSRSYTIAGGVIVAIGLLGLATTLYEVKQ